MSRGGSASAWTSRSTLVAFGYLALAWRLPEVVDIYASFAYRLLFLPPYLVASLVYDSAWGLENVAYAVGGLVPIDGGVLWEIGLLAAYYLFAVTATWLGRRLESAVRPLKRRPKRIDQRSER
ncbi:hypothetical protein [Halegenticoccus soli]|uniref:hypothetical protein n=1 Tax=Halegenticoccus soli TaxID=1985678 RepID=UPI000C6DDA26|nr:hypothetical protein [Halegenticoccus soli]